ncbi:uncharacterized protein FOBCDRAFT_280262 [Fusarium oxysporum Fo47]|uniref:Uncharacterized protein n=1 Tax=Fusarium oxysporum Fo47 TaxID=660027 RepID=W9JKA8_FUSOX|nr:uncharacterized protein FOBCDRAFT_280262 [Fusarium oxysporum Fo47]EWZ32492.1 hypothetical protein FOZG_14038 [Fusarium oxysporum Fo47]EWZ86109.1 hypothetical protein FOWG_11174 [Fusarium oxysporum f. sp. lycopersici MN25]QKD60636.1 hypothetical protein FOBCDRAFT_280262 [Fusarium oxysporum Fo47]
MKASVIYGLAALFGASRVIADCVEGHCETITPDYIVEHKCNMYRTGTTHEKVASAKDCAALCQAAGVGVCPYHPPPKKCIVSKPDGEDRTRADVMYITKVEIDDPFVEPDLFAETDAEAKEACLAREAALESELCSTDLAACKAGCAAVGDGTTCRSYAHDGGSPGTCLLYYKHIRELQPTGNFKVEGAWRSWDKEC